MMTMTSISPVINSVLVDDVPIDAQDAFFQPQRTLTDDSSHVTDEIILIVRIE